MKVASIEWMKNTKPVLSLLGTTVVQYQQRKNIQYEKQGNKITQRPDIDDDFY